jgi:site-specific DNA-methyltransferase (adenine-specific)
MAEVIRLPLDQVTPDPHNSNRGTDRGREALRHSLESRGFGRPLLLDKNRKVIAGNKTLAEAQALGYEELLVIESTGKQLIAHLRSDLDLDEPDAQVLGNDDNRIAELDLDWDPEVIAAQLEAGVDLSATWTGDELQALLASLQPQGGLVEGADPDAIPEQVETRCQPGERWALGRHKLWVGDCTDAAGVGRLFDGKRLRLVWTDPPYGVEYVGKTSDALTLENDRLPETGTEALCRAALALAVEYGEPGTACYVACPAGTPLPHFIAAVAGSGFQYRWQLVWIKDQFVLGRGDYHFRHENILYGWLPGAHYFTDDRTLDSVFEVPRPRASDQHPTMKPVALIEPMVKNSSRPGDLVYDPFLGSGSTILACQSTGRVAYGCEIDPQYASVCLARFEVATGETARRLD